MVLVGETPEPISYFGRDEEVSDSKLCLQQVDSLRKADDDPTDGFGEGV